MRPFFIDIRDIRNYALYAIAVAGIPLGWFVVALYIWRDEAVGFVMQVAGGLALVGFVAVYWFFDRIPSVPGEAELKQKLKARMDAGEILAKETVEALTPEDIALLNRLNYIFTGIITLTMGAIAYISYYPAKEMLGYPYTVAIPAGLALLFAVLTYKWAQLLPIIIAKGEKSIVDGMITNRFRRQEGKGIFSYLIVGTTELGVSKRDYRTLIVGEYVRIDYIPSFGNMVLHIIKPRHSPTEVKA